MKERREQEMKNRITATCYLVISFQIRKAKAHSRSSGLAQTELRGQRGWEGVPEVGGEGRATENHLSVLSQSLPFPCSPYKCQCLP